MARRIFISFQHGDRERARGFNLMRYAPNVAFEAVGRHLIDPVKSGDKAYVTNKIKEQLKGSSVTVVLIGEGTAGSDWVANEIAWSLDKDPPNGLLGIKLDRGVDVPEGLTDAGAEILDWNEPSDVQEFEAAIERAAQAAGSAPAARDAGSGSSGGSGSGSGGCGR
jgi:hypothetical protein